MNQKSLFDNPPPPTEQQKQLRRCKSATAVAIREFVGGRTDWLELHFHGAELEQYVCDETGCTPGTPLRIMRELIRKEGLPVRLKDRGKSLYEITDAGNGGEG